MQKLIEGAKLIKEVVQSDSILGVKFDKNLNRDTLKYRIVPSVHVNSASFKEVVEDLNIQPCYVERTMDRDSETYPIELEVCHEGVYFFTVLTEHEYNMDFDEWLNEEPNIDEEFLTETSPMPENERLMREAGVSHKDFI
jgi:hypothetical protein